MQSRPTARATDSVHPEFAVVHSRWSVRVAPRSSWVSCQTHAIPSAPTSAPLTPSAYSSSDQVVKLANISQFDPIGRPRPRSRVANPPPPAAAAARRLPGLNLSGLRRPAHSINRVHGHPAPFQRGQTPAIPLRSPKFCWIRPQMLRIRRTPNGPRGLLSPLTGKALLGEGV